MADMLASIGAFNALNLPQRADAVAGPAPGRAAASAGPGERSGIDSVPAILVSIDATNARIAHATTLYQTQVSSSLAAEASRDVLDSVLAMRKTAEQAVFQPPGPDGGPALQDAFEALRGRIDSVVAEADFDGVNLLADQGGPQSVTNASGVSFDVAGRLLDSAALGLAGLDLTTPDGALAALGASEAALATVTEAADGFTSEVTAARMQRESMREMALVLQPGLGDRIDPPADPDAARAAAGDAGKTLADSLLPLFTRSQDVMGMFG